MTCHEVQINLSLYLYNELDFSKEEAIEQHLSECALCKRALDREKAWHTSLNAQRADVPLEVLSECRRDLKNAISRAEPKQHISDWWAWARRLWFPHSSWSAQVALASFLVIAGFVAGRWMDRSSLPFGIGNVGVSQAGLIGSGVAHVRDIQAGDDHRVRIIVDRVHEQEITGSISDRAIRELLLAAARNSADPGIRVDSVEMLTGQNGPDVRDALLYSVTHDANPGVRLKALQGLRRFASDAATRESVMSVLRSDENPAVRSEAINILAPTTGEVHVTPEFASTLQQIMQSEQSDEYVRLRCMQLLSELKASSEAY